ncbi:GNAT family N-acetyltransferase [candidate division KSB1 bacterium]|nr:GNAT family N-acetyltransferase [candidate division KSB1 bacterium]
MNTRIVHVTADNIKDYPQAICFINPKHPQFHHKMDWLNEQFKNGLIIKLLFIEDVKRPVGFIEYVPGEYCWRSVDARGYMFIHCLYTNGKKFQHQGLGQLLLQEAEKDAQDMLGVATVTSDAAFMATQHLFIKHDYKLVAESGKEQLLLKPFKEGPLPSFNRGMLSPHLDKGWVILYSKQCPWVARFIDEIQPVLQEKGLVPKIIELKTPLQAQQAPALYGVFNLIHNGKILADRYISTTRFANIVEKELR